MLRLTLRQFMGLALMIGNTIEKKQIPEDLYPHISLYIGDPAPNGDISVDFTGPKSLVHS